MMLNYHNNTGRVNIFIWQSFHYSQVSEEVTQKCSLKEVFLNFLQNLEGNTCCEKHLFLQACNFIKKRLQHRCFPVNSKLFLEQLWWLLLCFEASMKKSQSHLETEFKFEKRRGILSFRTLRTNTCGALNYSQESSKIIEDTFHLND